MPITFNLDLSGKEEKRKQILENEARIKQAQADDIVALARNRDNDLLTTVSDRYIKTKDGLDAEYGKAKQVYNLGLSNAKSITDVEILDRNFADTVATLNKKATNLGILTAGVKDSKGGQLITDTELTKPKLYNLLSAVPATIEGQRGLQPDMVTVDDEFETGGERQEAISGANKGDLKSTGNDIRGELMVSEYDPEGNLVHSDVFKTKSDVLNVDPVTQSVKAEVDTKISNRDINEIKLKEAQQKQSLSTQEGLNKYLEGVIPDPDQRQAIVRKAMIDNAGIKTTKEANNFQMAQVFGEGFKDFFKKNSQTLDKDPFIKGRIKSFLDNYDNVIQKVTDQKDFQVLNASFNEVQKAKTSGNPYLIANAMDKAQSVINKLDAKVSVEKLDKTVFKDQAKKIEQSLELKSSLNQITEAWDGRFTGLLQASDTAKWMVNKLGFFREEGEESGERESAFRQKIDIANANIAKIMNIGAGLGDANRIKLLGDAKIDPSDTDEVFKEKLVSLYYLAYQRVQSTVDSMRATGKKIDLTTPEGRTLLQNADALHEAYVNASKKLGVKATDKYTRSIIENSPDINKNAHNIEEQSFNPNTPTTTQNGVITDSKALDDRFKGN